MKFNRMHSLALLAGVLSSSSALAVQQGDWLVRARLIQVSPDASSNILNLNVEDHYSLDIDITYMVNSNFGVELLLDTSSTHRVTMGGTDVVVARVLPPALIAQYHFAPSGKVRPYVGAGINYTMFLSEETAGPISDGSVELDNSAGLVAQAGVDYDMDDDWFMNVDVKYIDMSTTATITNTSAFGAKATVDVDINPTVIGVGIGKRF